MALLRRVLTPGLWEWHQDLLSDLPVSRQVSGGKQEAELRFPVSLSNALVSDHFILCSEKVGLITSVLFSFSPSYQVIRFSKLISNLPPGVKSLESSLFILHQQKSNQPSSSSVLPFGGSTDYWEGGLLADISEAFTILYYSLSLDWYRAHLQTCMHTLFFACLTFQKSIIFPYIYTEEPQTKDSFRRWCVPGTTHSLAKWSLF